jgi:hypothetical protein
VEVGTEVGERVVVVGFSVGLYVGSFVGFEVGLYDGS